MAQMNYLNVAETAGRGLADKQAFEANEQVMGMRQQAFDDQQRLAKLKWLAGAAKYAIDNQNAIPALLQEGQRRGIDVLGQVDPSQVTPEALSGIFDSAMVQLGQYQMEDVSADQVPAAQRDPLTNEISATSGRASQPKPPTSVAEYNVYAEQERAVGRDPLPYYEWTLKSEYETRRQGALGANSVIPAGKVADALAKYPRMQAAQRNVQDGRTLSRQISNWMLPGGPLYGQNLKYTEEGQAFERTVNEMFAHIQALTRIPGVGAQSDWEGKIAQAPLPSLDMYPAVREKAFDAYEALIKDLEAAVVAVASGEVSSVRDAVAPQIKPTGRTATNPETGQRVREMSDGTWEPVQ